MGRFRSLLACVLLISLPAHADWTASSGASVRYSDNVGNAQDSDDKRSDEILDGKISLADVLPLDGAYLFSAGADLEGQWFDHLSGLRNASIDAAVSLRRRWGLGALAPWARVALAASRSEYEVNLRDYTGYRAAVSGGQRFTQRLNLAIEYAYEHRAAKSTGEAVPGFSADVFSGNAQSLTGTVEYTLVNRLFLDTALSVRRGDVVSTSEPGYGVYSVSRAIVEDPVFGDEWYAYRLLSNSYSLRSGLGYQLTEHSLLTLSVQHTRTYASGYFYRVSIPELSWNYHF